jgi:metal-responsive CopG/Arc/MetJ family transcriptional regulator
MSDMVGVRLPPDVSPDDLDEEADKLGYDSRSEYLRDILAQRKQLFDEDKVTQQERRLQRLEGRVRELEDDYYGDGPDADAVDE